MSVSQISVLGVKQQLIFNSANSISEILSTLSLLGMSNVQRHKP